ncbi:TonB-dependent receptor domain-containing protein [Chitinophaga flava]|uniref:TonB-dependent receptor n=1 Tax=Chitinophaga flava TaxID=2259036 RepID=A0A365XV88_9BACT|nr:TonB-dependent receptor [Chitinophaga flava]RBL90070.1 TonB-dependent receptor [Chitinophaga flava]
MNTTLIRTILVKALLFVSVALNAQQIKSISGKVINAKNEPLTGNVLVLSVADSSFIKGVSYRDASFELPEINQKAVLLKLTSLQFPDTILRVEYNGQEHINLGNILIKNTRFQLSEVQVTSQVPMVRYSGNGNVDINVAKTILASSSSVTEILSRAPSVTVDESGLFFVFGKGEAIIYLNGKRITRQQMSAIPTSQISRIEIVSNPSARYDAEGKAVINIITKVNTQEGFIGSISQHVTVSDFAGTNANTFLDLSYMKGKFSLVGNYGLLVGKSREFLYTTRSRPAGADFMSSDLTIDWRRKFNNYSNFGLGAQYNINERSYVSLGYSGYVENQGGGQFSRNVITTNTERSLYVSDLNVDQQRWNHTGTFNYSTTFDSLGSNLFFGGQYSYFDGNTNDFIDEKSPTDISAAERFLKNLTDTRISIFTSQLDYTKIYSPRSKLELGAKFSYVHDKSATDFMVSEKGQLFKLDSGMSNNFLYSERIPAVYINYGGALTRKIDFSTGVRGEWTDFSLNTSYGGGEVIKRNYFNVFPNLSLSTTVNAVKLRVSYVSRILRPRYQGLNPFIIYQDRFTSIQGSPDLVPEKTHAFEIGANYRKFDLKIGYNYTIDPIMSAAIRGDSANSYVLKAINLEKDHTFFISLSRTINIGWWNSMNTATLSYSKSIDSRYAFVEPKPYVYLYSNNTFNVRNLFKIQLLAWYLSNKSYGIRFEEQKSTITVGLEKEFFKNALKLNLTANDIFHKTNSTGFYDVGKTAVFYDRSYNTNYFKFVGTYNFGKLKKSNYKIKSTGQAENNRAN